MAHLTLITIWRCRMIGILRLISQVKKLKLKEIKWLVQGRIA